MSATPLQTPNSSLLSLRFVQSRETKIGWSLGFQQGPYHLRVASSEADRIEAFRLRFLVFNLELNEGLEAAYATGQATDEFDSVCDHLIVEHAGTARLLEPIVCRRARWLRQMQVFTASVNSTSHLTSGWAAP